MTFINFSRLESQYYSEPFEPYIALPMCHDCCMNPPYKFTKFRVIGKEGDNYKLYYKLICPNNPEHSEKEWQYYGKRPWKFIWKKRIKKITNFF